MHAINGPGAFYTGLTVVQQKNLAFHSHKIFMRKKVLENSMFTLYFYVILHVQLLACNTVVIHVKNIFVKV